MRKRLLALAAVVGMVVGGGVLAMQPATASCDGDHDDHPSGHGDEIAGVYVEAPVASEVLGKDTVPEIGTPHGVYAEVQDDGEYTPVNVEAGMHHAGHKLLYTCSDSNIDEFAG